MGFSGNSGKLASSMKESTVLLSTQTNIAEISVMYLVAVPTQRKEYADSLVNVVKPLIKSTACDHIY